MELIKLKDVFAAEDIEWRLQQSGKAGDKIWAMALCYITNRAIMDRLDEVCRPEHWKNEFETGPGGGILCGISIKIGEEWITKWDGAENTAVESVKGGLSSAMKRAGVQWGIGRYLYDLETTFVKTSKDAKKYKNRGALKDKTWFSWETPQLPAWALSGEADNKKTSAEIVVFQRGEISEMMRDAGYSWSSGVTGITQKQSNAIFKLMTGNGYTRDECKAFYHWHLGENTATAQWGKDFIDLFETHSAAYAQHCIEGMPGSEIA